MQLVLANRNYSSWSLRVWMAFRLSGLNYDEVCLPLLAKDRGTGTGQMEPVFITDDRRRISDSLQIVDYLAQIRPDCGLWPRHPAIAKAARATVESLHIGFSRLRTHFPMNLERPKEPRSDADLAAAHGDIEELCQIWRHFRRKFARHGRFLFGAMSAADCYCAPFITRFDSYCLPMGDIEREYCREILAHPFMIQWCRAARRDSWRGQGRASHLL